MDKFENLKGSQLWPEVIAYRLGDSIKADEMQKMAFALKLETLIPNQIKRTKLMNPDREYVRSMKEKADTLLDTLKSIHDASENSVYISDIIDFSLAHKSERIDFIDIYSFANAFQGFLQDGLDKIKSGKDSASELHICVCICLVYESYLGVAPTCRDTDHTKDAAGASPYESICMEINRRYNTNLTWSTMRAAKRQTVIKVYRSALRERSFATTKEYLEDFLKFLKGNNKLFSIEDRNKIIVGSVLNYMYDVHNRLADLAKDQNETENLSTFIERKTTELCNALENEEDHKFLESINKKQINDWIISNLNFIEQNGSFFAQETPSPNHMDLLRRLAFLFIKKRLPYMDRSGIVVAGFGEDEHFPVTCSVVISGFFDEILLHADIEEIKISLENPVAILPFAQKEVLESFLYGSNTNYLGTLDGIIAEQLQKTVANVINLIPDLDDQQRISLLQESNPLISDTIKSIAANSKSYIFEKHINPIRAGINHLPKDTLAKVAESLVSITSYKKQVSLGDNSVGGDIDVAVISKGDGLIWIKRKHYFSPEKNQHFLNNYYRLGA